MNGNSPLSFIDWLISHAPEVALWAGGIVLGLLLLLVFCEMAWGWRSKSSSTPTESGAEAVLPPPTADHRDS